MNRHQQGPVADVLPVLSVHNLSVTYGDDATPTIVDCTFDVFPGECVLVTGPSGSGKSTLAMALAGIIPRSIEAEVSGEMIWQSSLQQPGKIGYVFQDPDAQFCMLTVADEIAFGLENLQIPREEMPAKTEASLRRVDLDVAPSDHHANFSGGMKQKLAIASALAMDCEFLILDEPTANLDPLATRQIFEQIVALRRMGRTLLIVEHKYSPLLPFVDKVLRVDADGRVTSLRPGELSRTLGRPSTNGEMAVEIGKNHLAIAWGAEMGALAMPRPAGKPLLAVADAALCYGDKTIWSGVSFTLHKGEFVAIVGPNGAGKSSLLEVMGGLLPVTSGEVRLWDTPVGRIREATRYQTIAYGFQNPEYQFLFERVADEMAGRVVGDDVPSKVLAQLAEFGLENHATASPYALSQGQKRRLAVGVMLRDDHDLFLFDEPTYGQDKASEETILCRLQQLQAAGKTVVTITHDMALVKRYATRVLVLADGQLLFDGTVKDLYAREDILQRAHLLDDVRPLHVGVKEDGALVRQSVAATARPVRVERNDEMHPRDRKAAARSPLAAIHPGVKLLTLVYIAVFTLFTNSFRELAVMWVVTLVVTFGLGWCNPWRALKRLSVVLAMYVIYLWTFAANAATPPGYHYENVLWFHLSLYGLWQGLIIALRTFSTVVLAYAFVETTDGTDFVVSLSQSFHLPPKLAYGVMAGTGFLQRVNHELRTFRMARRVRGRQGWWVTRPVSYALPMLSQSIRLSERLATAMEARGFYGKPANHWNGRTYFRRIPFRLWDFLFAGLCAVVVIGVFIAVSSR
ncbi:ATP-binding cassette domain-containing protein [Alicyclobacillus suci]|uniref:ATP-binding cassette domain-containing protein n=1 Tax=Alicyclobacillus suci TaxID=2816080 RepID=UPI001A8C17C3|nr:ATP-binding cassette domain-containing protein [Alicyclobacillus suci]